MPRQPYELSGGSKAWKPLWKKSDAAHDGSRKADFPAGLCAVKAALPCSVCSSWDCCTNLAALSRQRVFRVETVQVLHLVSAVVFTRQLDMVGLLVEGNDKIRGT